MIYIDTEHGSRTLDDALRELQIQLLREPDDGIESAEEVIYYCNSMKHQVTTLSDNERELELVKVIFSQNTLMCDDYVEYLESVTLDTKIDFIITKLEMTEDEIRETFEVLASIMGSNIHDNVDTIEDCTIGDMLGIKTINKETMDIVNSIGNTFDNCSSKKEREKLLAELEHQMSLLRERTK